MRRPGSPLAVAAPEQAPARVKAPAPPVPTAARAQAPSVVTTTSTASELTVVALPRAGTGAGNKDLAEIATELDDYFLKAADAGARVAALLDAPICELPNANHGLPGRVLSYGKNLRPTGWSWGGGGYGKSSSNGFSRFGRGDDGEGGGILSHSSTVEMLYAWEKKLHRHRAAHRPRRQEPGGHEPHQHRLRMLPLLYKGMIQSLVT